MKIEAILPAQLVPGSDARGHNWLVNIIHPLGVFCVVRGASQSEAEGRANEIVLAINPHDELVEALTALRQNIDVSTINNSKRSTARWTELVERADAVLTKGGAK